MALNSLTRIEVNIQTIEPIRVSSVGFYIFIGAAVGDLIGYGSKRTDWRLLCPI